MASGADEFIAQLDAELQRMLVGTGMPIRYDDSGFKMLEEACQKAWSNLTSVEQEWLVNESYRRVVELMKLPPKSY